MAIDAGIYRGLDIPDPMAGANAIGLYQQGKQDQVDRKNKLAALAQQQEMQGYALNDARAKDTYNKYIQHAIQDSGGDIGKMRDAALSSGHEEGILFAQHLDKVLKDQKEATKLQQFADTVKSIGQGTAGSNQTALLMNGSNAQPTYTQTPETETERQQKIVNMLSIDPTAGAAVAGALEKPREFALKQTEAKNLLNEKFNQQKEIQRQQALDRENAIRIAAGLRPPKEDNTLVSVIGPDGVTPVLVPRSQAAGMRPAVSVGAGADKPLNDTQSKALLFGSRMKAANDIFDKLEKLGTTTSTIGSNLPFLGTAINAMSSSDKQELNQGKRDFINAVLRRESGAAIASSEFDNGEKQYFPQIGDSVSVIQQKKANRDLAMRGVLAEVPEKHRNELFQNNKNLPSSNAKGWILHTDANGNKAYVSKDGSQYEEVK
jgi:hypothetical protein